MERESETSGTASDVRTTVTVADLKRELEEALRGRLASGGPFVRCMYFETAWALDGDRP